MSILLPVRRKTSAHTNTPGAPRRPHRIGREYFDDQPIHTLKPTRVTSKGGTVLVQLVRGIERSRKQTLRSINLTRPRQFSVLPNEWPNSHLGQAIAAQHLLRFQILPSYVPAGVYWISVKHSIVDIYLDSQPIQCSTELDVGGLDFIKAVDRKDYIVQNTTGEYFKLLESESDRPIISAAWSSRLDTLHDFLARITEQEGTPADERRAELFTVGDIRPTNVPAQDAIAYALVSPESVRSVTIDFDDFSISWSRSQEYGNTRHSKMGESTIVMYKDELELLSFAVSATATNAIGKNIRGILDRIADD